MFCLRKRERRWLQSRASWLRCLLHVFRVILILKKNSPEQSKHTTLSTILSQGHLLQTKKCATRNKSWFTARDKIQNNYLGLRNPHNRRHVSTDMKTANCVPGISSHVKMLHRGLFCRGEQCSRTTAPALFWPADLLRTIYRFYATNLISVLV